MQMIALGDPHRRQRPPELDAEEVDALAQSIKLLGQLRPGERAPRRGGRLRARSRATSAAPRSRRSGETQIRAEIRADDSQEDVRARR